MKQATLIIFAITLLVGPVRAESLVGLTVTNELVFFDSGSPNNSTTKPIGGLNAGDQLVGIDLRPSNNRLYGFAVDSNAGNASGGVGRVYQIDTATGMATLAATLSADPADATAPFPFQTVTGNFFGIDFNPTVDRLRVVSNTGQNLRINVDSGLTQLDEALAYAAADSNAGSPPGVVAAAYTNNVPNAMTTMLYTLDSALSTLNLQNPANAGTQNTVDLSSSTVFADAAFDISGTTGFGYVVLDGSMLGTIDLTNGQVTQLMDIQTTGSINGLTVLVPEPSGQFAALLVSLACGFTYARSSRRGR